MGKSYKPKHHRKSVKNKYLQGILKCYCDEFGGTNKKERCLSRVIRAREKVILKKEVENKNE